MKLLMQGFQPGVIHMGVNLRRVDVTVAGQFLGDAQIRAATE
jgi:hypothetical protein